MQEKKTNWLGVVIAVALVILILFGVWLINENINQPREDTNYFDTEEIEGEDIDISDGLDEDSSSKDSTASILDASEEDTDTQDSEVSEEEEADSEDQEAGQDDDEEDETKLTEDDDTADSNEDDDTDNATTDQEESTKKSAGSPEEEEEESQDSSVNTNNLKSNQIIAKVYFVEEDKAKFEIIDCGVEDANYCVKGNTFSTTGSASKVEDGATYLLTADIEDPGSGKDFSLSNVKVQRQ